MGMAEPKVQPPRPQKLADVLPPQALPGEGELAPMFREPEPSKKNLDQLELSPKPKKPLSPELRRAAWLLAVLVVTLILGFAVMRFSFLENRVFWAVAAVKDIAKDSFHLPGLPQLESSEPATPTSFTSLVRQASLSDLWTLFTRGGEALDRFQKTIQSYKTLTEELAVFL